ncbi:MAG: TRAP transporter large permease subunit, partial [Candidatus Aminicenantes bacterium]|nr:TRAP transporter large permease subunit [Candidatus Aminicenantes bacterium]
QPSRKEKRPTASSPGEANGNTTRLNAPMRVQPSISAASSISGPIIPPSVIMVVFAMLTEVSVASLFLGGFLVRLRLVDGMRQGALGLGLELGRDGQVAQGRLLRRRKSLGLGDDAAPSGRAAPGPAASAHEVDVLDEALRPRP